MRRRFFCFIVETSFQFHFQIEIETKNFVAFDFKGEIETKIKQCHAFVFLLRKNAIERSITLNFVFTTKNRKQNKKG